MKTTMKTKTNLKAGLAGYNHNLSSPRKAVAIKTGVRAGLAGINHNQSRAR